MKSPISSAERAQIIRDLLGKQVHVEVDRPIGHVHKGMVYPVNYGFIPGLMAGDGEDQDAYILGVTQPVEAFDGIVIGAVCRRDDVEDKLVVAPAGMEFHQGQIAQAVHFQEQYFDTYIQCLLRKSCGVLPWRENQGQKEYLIVFESFSKCWSLPKGHMEAGETEEETALRELQEETGLTATLDLQRRATIEYPLSPIGRKRVVFFPGKVDGLLQLREGKTENFKWVTAEELGDYLFPDTAAACQTIL